MPEDNSAQQAALIQAGTAIATTAGSAYSANANDKKARAWNEMMYARSRADALADWQMQNQYNSPQAQMARLKAAGLNPNMVYGHGQVEQQAANVRPADYGNYHPETPNFDMTPLGNAINNYFDNQVKTAQHDNLKAALGVMEQEKQLKAAQTLGALADVDLKKFDFGLKSDLRSTTIEAARANLNETLANINSKNASTQFTLDENQRQAAMQAPNLQQAFLRVTQLGLQNKQIKATTAQVNQAIENLKIDARIKKVQADMWEKGINPHDPAYQRVLMSLFQDLIDYLKPGGDDGPVYSPPKDPDWKPIDNGVHR